MHRNLLARAKKLREHNRLLETVPGSGFHAADRDHLGHLRAPQHQGLPRVAEHLIAFFGEDDVRFIDDDAEYALQTLKAYQQRYADLDPFEMTGTQRKLLGKYLPRATMQELDGVAVLILRLTEWNDYLQALYEMGVGITGAPLLPDSEAGIS